MNANTFKSLMTNNFLIIIYYYYDINLENLTNKIKNAFLKYLLITEKLDISFNSPKYDESND